MFSIFNVPLFAVFILGLLWKRMTGSAGFAGLLAGTLGAVVVFILNRFGVLSFSGQGSSFVGGRVGFALALIAAAVVSRFTTAKPEAELVGLVRSVTPAAMIAVEREPGWYRSPVVLSVAVLNLSTAGYVFFQVF